MIHLYLAEEMDENIACEAAGAPNKFASPISRTGEMGIDWLAFLKWSIEGSDP
jgi:hypothetical protein